MTTTNNRYLIPVLIAGIIGLTLFFTSSCRGQATVEHDSTNYNYEEYNPIHIETVVDSLEPGIYALGVLIDIDSGWQVKSMYRKGMNHFHTVLKYEHNDLVVHFERTENGFRHYYDDNSCAYYENHLYIWDKVVIKNKSFPLKLKAFIKVEIYKGPINFIQEYKDLEFIIKH